MWIRDLNEDRFYIKLHLLFFEMARKYYVGFLACSKDYGKCCK